MSSRPTEWRQTKGVLQVNHEFGNLEAYGHHIYNRHLAVELYQAGFCAQGCEKAASDDNHFCTVTG